jgi:hypothetical protein
LFNTPSLNFFGGVFLVSGCQFLQAATLENRVMPFHLAAGRSPTAKKGGVAAGGS